MSAPDAEAVRSIWADHLPLFLTTAALPLLDDWAATNRARAQADDSSAPQPYRQSRHGPGHTPAEAASLIGFLRAQAEADTPFSFNALWRERQGGRSYPFYIEDYAGPLTISKNAYEDAGKAKTRRLLAAIRRDVRGCMEPPVGYTLLSGDFRSCHAHIAAALTDDQQLAHDLESDFHQAIGDQLVGSTVPPNRRRDFGKAFNNAMLFGVTPVGLQRNILEEFGKEVGLTWAKKQWAWWWRRYPALAAFRDEVIALVAQAQQSNMALELIAPSGRVSRFSAAEVMGQVAKGSGKLAKGPSGVWRSVFSACFRAVEGDLLDRTLAHWHEQEKLIECGRLVMPLYDALYVAAESGTGGMVACALRAAAERAAEELGIPEMKLVVTP